jgi:hypothetical protein
MQALIREVIAAHSGEYGPAKGWQEGVVSAMEEIVPKSVWGWLDSLLTPFLVRVSLAAEKKQPAHVGDRWQLGM